MQQKSDLTTEIRYVKGVGPKKTDLLKKIGVETVRDMLYYLPYRYEDRSHFVSVSDLKLHEVATVKGEIKSMDNFRTRKGAAIFQIKVDDGTGVIYGVWFNQPYIRRFFKRGDKIIMYGKMEIYDKLQMNHPEYEIFEGSEEKDSVHIGRVVPMYHLARDIGQRYLRTVSSNTIGQYARFVRDLLPTRIRARNKLVDLKFALQNIHFPVKEENQKRAYRRIVFDEFFLLQLAVALKRKNFKENLTGLAHVVEGPLVAGFKKSLPYKLTGGQTRAVKDIERDMASSKPMNRLLEGDVGSGKTIVAAHAAIVTIQNGNQAALMAPTEILAEQHFVTLSELFNPLGINVVMLVNGLTPRARRDTLDRIAGGEAEVVVGTHALIEEKVEFKNLGLVIIDEQHKFGVAQRAKLVTKEKAPDVLLMTATPIPRTLALTLYGDLDVSCIKEMPPGRRPITTYWMEELQRESVYNFIREEVSSGRQAYVVYPRIEDSKSIEVKSAIEMYEELKKRIFPDLRIGLVHGRMKASEKEVIMKDFKKRKIDILVSTVMIEVGIDVANASVMLVENSERFGLSQLHQLRGRIGRGEFDSYCILLGNPGTEKAALRLKAISESSDGFKIAEHDFNLRGPGELFGTRQHGLPEIKFGNIQNDLEIMELARKEAFELVTEDPELKREENKTIKDNLYHRFRGKLDLIKIG